MLTADEILVEGEELIGDYNAQIARWTEGTWTSTLPTLYVILSDHRLILQPHSRKRHEPAVIPRTYIKKADELIMGIRHGVLIYLTTGHQIGMFIADDPERNVYRTLKHRFIPPKPIPWKPELNLDSIEKMIAFLDKL